jgi:pimeloyl-ACP methyl ester carboxylesterase
MTTFVLVHGAGTGGWLWDTEAKILRRRGHTVISPTLVGVGERADEGGQDTDLTAHIDEVVDIVRGQVAPDVVIVGFSYGGLVAGGVSEKVPDHVAALIFLDAFVPVDGQSLFDAMPPEMSEALEAAARATGGGWRLPPIPLERLGGLGTLGQDVDLEDIRPQLGRRGTQPIATYQEPSRVSNPAAQAIPRVYIASTEHPEGDPMAAVADRMREVGVPVVELQTGHFPMLTMPVELADTLESITATL